MDLLILQLFIILLLSDVLTSTQLDPVYNQHHLQRGKLNHFTTLEGGDRDIESIKHENKEKLIIICFNILKMPLSV